MLQDHTEESDFSSECKEEVARDQIRSNQDYRCPFGRPLCQTTVFCSLPCLSNSVVGSVLTILAGHLVLMVRNSISSARVCCMLAVMRWSPWRQAQLPVECGV